MALRESVKILDSTLRDGGLVNDFRFDDDFVRALYRTNIAAGVDYMEMGYRASKEMFDVSQFGAWKFSDDEKILEVIGEPDESIKLAIMADVGRCDFKNDIKLKSQSPVSLIRVATYLHQMTEALEMIEDAKNKGYEVSCNIMAISTSQEADLRNALNMLASSPVDVIYIVDSFGSLYPKQIENLAKIYKEYADKGGKILGMHAHNNQQLAFANTLEALDDGVDWLDATYAGMGRGAGNCPMENLLGLFNNSKYNIFPALQFTESYMDPLKEEGLQWGYDIPYLLTGIHNQHPRSAISYIKSERKDIAKFYTEITGAN
jgi:4-hydroxy 2-oxovalerate aldolase